VCVVGGRVWGGLFFWRGGSYVLSFLGGCGLWGCVEKQVGCVWLVGGGRFGGFWRWLGAIDRR